LPAHLGAEIERGAWPEHPTFRLVQEAAGATDDDMLSTFNMGIGMVLVVGPDDAERLLEEPAAHEAHRIGRVVAGAGVRIVG
jgi:phosphoribosylformylglycinamidine cyclo-ligase